MQSNEDEWILMLNYDSVELERKTLDFNDENYKYDYAPWRMFLNS